MRISSRTLHLKARRTLRRFRAPLLGIAVLSCAGIVAAVFAGSEVRTIHVFPTGVSSEGWTKEHLALEQVLGPQAIFTDFTRDNSAFVIVAEGSATDSESDGGGESAPAQGEWGETGVDEVASGEESDELGIKNYELSAEEEVIDNGLQTTDEYPLPTSPSEGEEASDSDTTNLQLPTPNSEAADEALQPTTYLPAGEAGNLQPDAGEAPLSDVSAFEYLHSALRNLIGASVWAEEDDGVTSEELGVRSDEDPHPSPLPEGEGGDGEANTANLQLPTSDLEETDAANLQLPTANSDIADEALQATKLPSYQADTEDMRSCTVLDIECHTIQFDGFDIGSLLSDYGVRQYTLRMSFAAKSFGEPFTPDTLMVRYFYRGEWRIAGQVTIDREMANFENGGHLSFALPDMSTWDALKDFKVEVEFIHHSEVRTEVFLDSVWVDAEYVVDAADEPLLEASNIVAELAILEDSGRPDLLMADDKRIELTAVEDDMGADVVIRSDADVYDGLTSARAYIAVTNRLDDEATFNLRAHIGRQAEVVRVLERIENVSTANDTPSYSEVAYFCEGGWELGEADSLQITTDRGEELTGDSDEELTGDSLQLTEDEQPSADGDESSLQPESSQLTPDEEVTLTSPPQPSPSQGEGDDGELSGDSVQLSETDGDESSLQAESSQLTPSSGVDTQATTLSTTYTCKATGEMETCNSFNADKTNCIVGNERVSVDETIAYESAWRDVPVSPFSANEATGGSILARLFGGAGEVVIAPNLSNGYESEEEFTLLPQETRFFAVDVSFPVQRAGELLIEAHGDDIDALRSVWWRSGFKYRMPITLVPQSDVVDTQAPTLHEVSIDRTFADFFTHASLDGRDVRFYDANTRTELPVKEFTYTYIDQEAHYAVELPDGGTNGTTSIYAYFGNDHVDGGDRIPAPALVSEPIEYAGLLEPEDGAVASIVSERDQNSIMVPEGADVWPLALGAMRDVFIPDTSERLFARGPISLAPAESEYRAGVRTLAFALAKDTHTTPIRLQDGRISTLLERYRLASSTLAFGAMEELPIPAVSVYEPLARPELFEGIKYLRELRDPRFHTFRDALRDFALGDRPEFSLQYQAQKGTVNRFLRGLFRDRLARVGEVRLLHGGVRVEDVHFEIVYGAEGQWTLRMTEMPRAIEPGLYTLEISVDELGTVFTDSFDFYWGVLAINTPQSIYLPDDSVDFHMAALDDKGDTICTAELHLTVTDPEGNAQEIGVEPQGTCGANNVTDDPDYLAWYRPQTVGTYALELTHVNQDGDVVHRVQDAFAVAESVPFTIRRTGATRIWPKATYVMELELTATSDFKGQFIEAVPSNFILTDAGDGESDTWGGAKRITWDVDLVAGETQTFSYEYDAPDISPYLYLLGPAEVRAESGLPFVEKRQWKLASDATAQYTEAISSFTINSVCNTYASTTLSGVPANAIVEIAVTAANNAAAARSAGVRAVGSSLNRSLPIDRLMSATGNNGYTVHVVADSNSRIEACATNNTDVIFYVLGYWTSGTYNELAAVSIDPNAGTTNDNTWNAFDLNNGVGNGHVAEIVLTNFLDTTDYYAGVRPLNSSLDRRVLIHQRQRSGHGSQATMLVTASTTTGRIEGFAQVEGAAAATIDYNLMGYWSSMPTNLTYVDRFASTTVPSLSTTWQTLALDGYGTSRGHIAEILLGNKSHTTSNTLGVRSSGSSLTRTQSIHTADSGAAGTSLNTRRMHVQTGATASSTIEYYAETPSDAEFYLLGSWGPSNYSPEAPALYDVPFESEKTGSSTPYVDFSATDPDGTSDIEYQIEWDDDADLDASPLGSEVSTSTNSYFVNTVSGGDTSPFNEGERVRFTMQSSLTTGTTYYWRVRAKDVSGADDYGEWSEVRSFTYVADTNSKAWYQNEDAQFEAGTLVGTETYGADAVRISTDPPEGAMVAYGSGASTTPNVRTWNGSAWSASSSAQDVGGQISWTVLRAAPTRNEYLLGTQDVNGDVNVQVYDGVSGTWGDLLEIGVNASSSDSRAFDIAYRSLSGDAVVAVCEQGRDPHYAVWDGANWSATSTIDLTFATGCIWASVAASPATDEVVFLGQAHPTNAGNDFEAQVLTDMLWGNTYVAGANTAGEEMFERMNVAYEHSGDEAVIALGNGNNNNFVGAVWNTVAQAWTPYTNRGTVNDFEWADFAVDDGTDNLALCYVDEGSQGQIANWNGSTNTWDTYVATTFQVDGNLNGDATYHARPMSCQYETTAGRDGYLMIPYADETNGRYRVWTGASFAATEQSISTIAYSWTVTSVRTGDGQVLTVFRDEANDRYDFSRWAGAGWSDRESLDTSMSDDTQPFAEPIALAAQIYQESSGSIVSPIVDFDNVPGRSTWGEVLWSAYEPTGSEVTLRVYYATTTAVCNVPVPDGALTGNSTGFAASASPLNISGLSTSTYNMLCIKATLSSTGAESPTLDDWTISWVRRPYLSGEAFRFYTNTASYTPSDAWPLGLTDLAENTAISPSDSPPKPGDVLRLRMSVMDENVALSAGDKAFKLQYAEGATCSADLSWADVAPIGSTTALWRGYANNITSSWYDENWSGRVAITIDEAQVEDTLTNFPVYVNLGDLDATFWSSVNSGGGDIRLTDSAGSEVAREVVSASTTTQTGELYFKASTISSTTDTTYYLYFGNSGASDYASTSAYGAQNVWDANYVLVTHMNDRTTASTLNSAGVSNNGTKQSANNPVQSTTALFGVSQDFVNDDISHGDLGIGATSHTLETWVYPDTLSGSGDQGTYGFSIAGASPTGVYAPWLTVGGTGATADEVRYCAYQTSSTCTTSSGAGITTGAWYYIAATGVKSGSTIVKVNDTQRISYTNAGNADWPTQFTLGDLRPTRLIYFDGKIDEVRVSNTVRSAAWQKATYQNGVGGLVALSGSESLGDGSTLPSTLLSTSDVRESYEEENVSVGNPNALSIGEEGEWDWVIENNAATAGTEYCFRMIGSDGVALNDYTRYPELVTNDTPEIPVHEAPFDNIGTASTTPFFEFSTSDPESDDVHYEIQIDDDFAFGSPTLDRNSLDHFSEFKNLITPADKSPFTSSQSVRFTPTTGLTSGTTYWWRVRAQDPSGSGAWGEWSDPTSLTVMSVTATAWYQTTFNQFNRDSQDNTEASSTADSVTLALGETAGTVTGPAISFAWKTLGNAWGELDWTENETYGTLRTYIEYNTGSAWARIPDADLAGNSTGFAAGPVSLLGLDPARFTEIRLVASLQDASGSPALNSWTLTWGYAVEQPTLITLFDNEKVGTTTPSFTFYSTDPDTDDLEYEIMWSTDSTFTTGTTSRTSDVHTTQFANTASSTDDSPFSDGDTIRFTIQSGDALVNGTTYWWRVRARDPLPGADVWSVWSPVRSFTVDTTIDVSTWFQTTDAQFDTATLSGLQTTGVGGVEVTTTVSEALVAYAENSIQTPRYKLWNGTAWGSEKSAQNVGERVYWVKTAAASTRNEYALATGGLSGAVKVQIYDSGTQSFGDLTTLSVMPSALRRGLDVVYETDSGDALAVACYGTDATYSVWNGSSWTATSTVNLSFTQNCEWLELASDPESDEIILIARANPAETPYDFEALVWTGSAWGNSTLQGSMEAGDAENIGMSVIYEESGDTAVFVTSNNTNPSFHYRTWTGSWSGTSSVTIADDLETPKFARDSGSENLVMCYVAQNTQLYYMRWTAGAFVTPATNISADSNGKDGSNSFDCTFETTAGRDGFIMFPYTDATNDFYRYYDTTLGLQAETALETVQDSWSVKSVRTGDGNILAVFYDEATNTQYDFSYWNGIGPWSVRESLETSVAALVSPAVPVDVVARAYPSITSGSIVSDPIVFEDGSGPGWGSASSSDDTPNASTILYQVEWYDSGSETWSLIPDGVIAGNSSGTSANYIDLSGVSYTTYDTIRLVANFTCVAGDCPTLYDWTVTWTEGLTISGSAEEYDLTTDVTTGTVAVAVDGELQPETGTIAGGLWSVSNVTFFPGDTVQVWVQGGATDADEAIAVTKVVGAGNVTGMKLYEGHLTLGAGMATTTSNAELALYDYSASGNNEDIFFEVDAGNDLTMCAPVGCADTGLIILPGYTYRPDSANAGNVTTHDMRIDGTLVADGNTFYVSGSWDNNATSTMNTSTVVFTATSTSESIDSTGALSASFNNVTLGQTSGSAVWTLGSAWDVNGNLTVTYGTLTASTSPITLAGNFAIGANGVFVKGTATTTFDGTGTATLTDSRAVKQDLGKLYVNGTSKTVRLGSAASTTDVTIAVGNTLDVTASNYLLEVQGDFRNAGTFSSQGGTVLFTATTTGHVIDPGPSSFANVTFDGVGGNWGFSAANVTVLRDFTIRKGIVTLPTGLLSVGQSFTVADGEFFVHNNAEVRMNSTTPGRTVTPLNSPFYHLNFFGSGGTWSFGQANATTSGNFTVSLGTVTLPSGMLYVAGDFENEAGTIQANNGTVQLHTVDSQKLLKLSGSSLNHVRFTGVTGGGGDWYNSSWSYRIPITIPAAQVDDDVTNFPVYVDLSHLGEHFWSNVKETGADLRVTASNGTSEQAFELVSFSTTTKTGELYFKASSLASTTDSEFYLYYGNTLASSYGEGDQYGSEAVWTNGYVGVYHLQEDVAGTGNNGAHKDSTSADRDGDDSISQSAVSGKLGRAADMSLTGTADYIRLPNTVLDGRTDVVVSWWMRTSDTGSQAVVSGANTGDSNEFLLFFSSNTSFVPYNSSLTATFAVSNIANDAWRYVVYRAADTANQSYLWLDGVAESENPLAHTIAALSVGSGGLILGQEQDSVGAGFDAAQAYDGYLDEIRFATTTRTTGWISTEYKNQNSASTFYATSTYESAASRTFTDINATIAGNVDIVSGSVNLPTGTLTLRGSLTNTGSFSANGGTVLFATSTLGRTVDVGDSNFYNVEFNNASGGWTIADHATSTNNWTITDASSFAVQTGKRVAVGGTFANSDPGATDWTGSTLHLYSGTSYTVGSSTQAAETYGTLSIAVNTDVKMWQSSASAYSVDSTGSLYSQDHAEQNGDLYIWGQYARTTGTEYWSHATDFDGTALGGSPRPVDVRFASGASATFTGASLTMLGGASASTTLANQGSGSYALTLSGSTLNAQYYEITNTDSQGLALLASSTVTSLSDGAFTLTQNAGSMITVSSTTINTNIAKQIDRVSFATSTGITSGYNVTATGTATSYWWFKTSYGNYDGESYDNDPVAGAGSIRWDDSGYTISVSGTVYTGEGTGVPAFCDGSTQVVRIVVNGGASSTASCAAGTGIYTVPTVTFNGDAVLTAYLDTNGGAKAVTVTRTPSGNIAGFNMYQNRVIVRHEGTDPLTIAHLAYFDADNDTDIPFVASSTTATYVQNAQTALYIWQNKTFAPGGNITLHANASTTPYDGTLRMVASSTLTAVGTENHTIGGSWIVGTSSTFTRAGSTVTFTATTTGKTIAPSSTFNNLVMNGVGGGWNIASSTTVAENLTVSAGTATGTASVTVQNGALSGDGTLAMTGGTVTVGKGGNFGGASNWTFSDLTLGDGTANTTTKVGAGNVNVSGTLSVLASHTLDAGAVNWTLTGAGSALAVSGTFTANTSTTTFAGTSAMTVPALTYHNLVLAPSVAGSPIYTLSVGSPNAYSLTLGNGTNPVTVQADTNDPLLTVSDDVTIRANATLQASGANDLRIGGSYLNQGTFTSNSGGVVFNSTDVGESITPGASSFHHLTVSGAGGGWTLAGHATTTGNMTLTQGASFAVQSGRTVVVQGAFLNAMGGALTDWSDSTLYLNSGTAYSLNTKSTGDDVYGTLRIGANTDVRMWNSTSTYYTVSGSGSLYSQDHNAGDGILYIWGDYGRSTGADYWSYATDFDGEDISGTPRLAKVYLANQATTTLSGGTLEILGTSGNPTTIENQGSGTYAIEVGGGTFNAQYFSVRDINRWGMRFTGAPTVSMGNGDLLLEQNGGTMLSIAGSVIDANPVELIANMSFATSSGITSGYNASTTDTSASSWRFIPGSGNYYGEAYDNDRGGNPGYLIFSDSDDEVTIAGNVYSDESGTVSSVCNGSAQVVRLIIQGNTTSSSSVACAAGTGYYEFIGVSGYTPGDTATVYLDGTTPKAANVTVDLVTSINNMHLYEDRVVLRHEDTSPITIDNLAVYDSDNDSDIPFTAHSGSPDTLTLLTGSKLIVWSGKTFTPGGNVTVAPDGTGVAYDGTIELQNNAVYRSSSTSAEVIQIGGSWLTGTGATFVAGTSTVTFTATTTGKTVSPDTSAFNNITFNGVGGAWTFVERDATTTNDFLITAGSVTLGTSTLAVGGSFVNSGTMSAASTSIRFSSAQAETVTFNGYEVGSLSFAGAGAHTMTDANATSTGSVSISAGSVILPSGTFAVANSFVRSGGAFTHGGTLRLYGTLASQSITLGGSTLRNLTVAGTGSWAFTDTNATSTGTTTVAQGALTGPSAQFGIGGSLIVQGTYNVNGGRTFFFATTTGQIVNASTTVFADVFFRGTDGGWTIATSSTSTGAWRLLAGASYTMATGTTLSVGGVFENLIGGNATDWTNSTLYLYATDTAYTINSKTQGGDSYAYLTLGPNIDVKMWDSSGATTTVHASSSLYSMDHGGSNPGDLYIWGEYSSTGNDTWSYAKDFDGVSLGGSPRQVDVRIASSSTLSFGSGTLEIVGTASASTTIAVMDSGAYTVTKTGGTINAQYYSVRDLTASGFTLAGAVTVTSLSRGDWELSKNAGVLLTVSAATIDQNPSKQLAYMRFASTSGVATGTNVRLSGATTNFWEFTGHYGGFDGEYEDNDGVDACGTLRWDDSACLEVSQAHYRFRADDGGEGAPANEWYDPDWTYRKRVTISNPNSTALTEYPVRMQVPYEDEMLTNYDDLRFTDDSGTTSLPYFVESYTTATATVWVKVSSISAQTSGTIFMYYGNSFAANAESGTDAFTYFDDFEDNDIAEYSGDTTYFDVVADSGAEGAYVLEADSSKVGDFTASGLYQTDATFSSSTVYRFMQYIDASENDDSPCTLFAVQGVGQNYGVCLTQYPVDALKLVRDVESDYGSGVTMSSKTTTWTTGWYTVEVDWLAGGTMNTAVYNSAGTQVATTSTSSTLYKSGGTGFSFWSQHGAWDFVSARPYVESEPSATFGTEQTGGGASWLAAQDTPVSLDSNTSFRVRMSVENSGGDEPSQEFRLQYAPKGESGTCAAVPEVDYNDVPNQTGCGVHDICMVSSPQYADQAPTTQHLDTISGLTFTAGYMVENPSNQSTSMTLTASRLTEIEYAVELTSFADESSYCLRTTDGGIELDSYANIAEVSVNGTPAITEWSLNSEKPIYLIEGTTTAIMATGTVSDVNGSGDLLFATSTIYRGGVGPTCTEDPNNCYRPSPLVCGLDYGNCDTNTCPIICTADIWYLAEPTDSGSPNDGEYWYADVYIVDQSNNVATSTSQGVLLMTLHGVGLANNNIDYGNRNLGEDTADINEISQAQNTGNAPIDVDIAGTDLVNGGSTIPVGNQLASTTGFIYSDCTVCVSLAGTASNLELDLPKPTATSTPVIDNIYWGIYVPLTAAAAAHQGQNTFYATAD